MTATASPRRTEPGVLLLASALAMLALGPVLLSRGFSLVGDMVFVPDQPWKDRWLGVDGSAPRAVPGDAVVSAVTQLVAGDLVQKALLAMVLVGGAVGMARLLTGQGWRAQAAAAVLFIWNPFVYERLAIGHWALLCGYAALPWVAAAAEDVRERRRSGLLALCLSVAVAAASSPTGGALAGVLALAVVAARPRVVPLLVAVGTVTAVNLPWLLPGLLSTGGVPGDSTGVEAFASRADSSLGTFGSLLSLGGIWKTSIVPAERTVLPLAVLTLGLVVLGLASAARAARRGDRTAAAFVATGLAGLLLAWGPSTGLARPLFEWWVATAPGGGLVRDAQKWVAPLALAASWGLGRVVAGASHRWPSVPGAGAATAMLTLLPVALLPGMAWGQFGRLAPVQYPSEWSAVAATMAEVGVDKQRVVVLPFEVYRRFDWNDQRAVLDPAPRFFPGDLLVNDVLRVGDGRAVAGEDRDAALVQAAFEGDPARLGSTLSAVGARWLLVEKGTPGAETLPELPGSVVHDGAELRLLRLDSPRAEQPSAPRWRTAVLLVDGLVLAGVMLVSGTALYGRVRAILARDTRAARTRAA